MKAKTLKQFAENRCLLKLHVNKLEECSTKVHKHEDFEKSLDEMIGRYRWIDGYMWALSDGGVITREQRYAYMKEADTIWDTAGIEDQEEGEVESERTNGL